MLWLIIGGAVIAYAALAASRRRKQRLVERTWRGTALRHLQDRLASAGIAIDDTTARDVSNAFFDALYRGFGARSFAALMRRMVETDADESDSIAGNACDDAARLLPLESRATGAALIRIAMTDAGAAAQRAAEESGEV